MDNNKIIKFIEERLMNLNYCINTDKSNEKMLFTWKYARLELQVILDLLKNKPNS